MIWSITDKVPKIEERIPLKQGLKPNSSSSSSIGRDVIEERIPLKQGLKQILQRGIPEVIDIEERIPLKQGLKPTRQSAQKGEIK